MSFSLGTASPAYPAPVMLDVSPGEGSRAVAATIQWNSIRQTAPGYIANINLLAQFNSGQFTSVQSVWIDNLSNPWPIILAVSETTGQRIYVPGNAQGLYPLIVPFAPIFTVQLLLSLNAGFTLAGILPVTNLSFLNVPRQSSLIDEFPAFGITGPALSTGGSGVALAFTATGTANGAPIILAPQSTSQRWAITGLDIDCNVNANTSWTAFATAAVQLSQTTTVLWAGKWVVTPNGRQGFRTVEDFSTPILCTNALQGVTLSVTLLPTSGSLSVNYLVRYVAITVTT